MILIATRDADLARKIGAVLDDKKNYLIEARDAKEFRHKVHSSQPQILIVDARFGGSGFEVITELPKIVFAVRSTPAVIVLLPWRSSKAKAVAAEFGAFDVLSTDRRGWLTELPKAISDAKAAREAGLLELPPPTRELYH